MSPIYSQPPLDIGDIANFARRGRIGMTPRTGETLRTVSGRLTTPFPDLRGVSDVERAMCRIDAWIIFNAEREAEARGLDDWPSLSAMCLSPADRSEAEALLFDESFAELHGTQAA